MINVVVLVGRLTRDPEIRRANTGNSVCNFTIAVNRTFKQPGQPEADFPSIVCFGKTAENLCQFQRKGSLIGVTGRLQTRSFDDQNGQRQYRTEVVADRIDWLESRAQAAAHQGGYGQGYPDNSYGGGYDGGYGQSYNQGGYGQNAGYGGYGNGGGYDGGYNNSYSQNSGYNNNSYGGGGGYGQNSYNKSSKPAYNNGPASSNANTSDYPSSGPAYTNPSAAASSDGDDVLSNSFDDDSDLDISRDDLPF